MKKTILTIFSLLLIMAMNTNVFGQTQQTRYTTTKISNWDDATAWTCVRGTDADSPDCPNPMAPPPRTITGKMTVIINHGAYNNPFIINPGDPIVVRNTIPGGGATLVFGGLGGGFSKTFVDISTFADSTGSLIEFGQHNLNLFNGNTMTINTGGTLSVESCAFLRNYNLIIHGEGAVGNGAVGVWNGDIRRTNTTPGYWNRPWCDADGANGIHLSTGVPTNLVDCDRVNSDCAPVIIDDCDPASSGNTDTDGDSVSDICSLDDDNDGLTDCVDNGLQDVPVRELFNITGDATPAADPLEIQLTQELSNQKGAAMSYGRVDFRISFTLALQAYLGIHDYAGADGIGLIFHNDPVGENAVGYPGVSLGSGGIRHGVVLEIDVWRNSQANEPVQDHTSIWESDVLTGSSGTFPGNYLTTAIEHGNIEDGTWHDVLIAWDAPTQTLTYKLNGNHAGTVAPFDHRAYFDGADRVHFGATAGTGLFADGNDYRVRFIDFCQVPVTLDPDGDNLPNHLDLDSDGDGISDLEESLKRSAADLANLAAWDMNDDGQIDPGVFTDTNGNGLAEVVENVNGVNNGTDPDDTDSDGTPDFYDRDADADGCPDAIEGDRGPTFDFTDIVSGGSLDPTQYPSTAASRGRHGWPAEPLQGDGSSVDNTTNPCTDYGDAPDTYRTSLAGGNPAVSIIATDPASLRPSFFIGPGIDLEADGQPGTNADGDETTQEGGVVFHYDNQVITATVTVVNNTDDEGLVCCWLDGGTASAAAALNITGTFEDTLDEERCADVPANSGSADYTLSSWHFPAFAATNTYARCRLSTASALSPVGSEAMSERGEVEDTFLPVRPTSATIGAFSVGLDSVEEFLAQLSGRNDLQALLEQYNPALAQTLAGAAAGALHEALEAVLDPDGDGLLAVARWETLEEHGTLGFYLERRDPGAADFTRVNPALLLGLIDAPHGGQYWLADPGVGARGTYRYRLVEKEVWGTQKSYDLEPVHVDPGQSSRMKQARRFTKAHKEAANAFSAWKVLGPGYGARRRAPQPPRFEKVVTQLAARYSAQAEGLAAAQKSAESSRRNWLYTDQPGLYRLTVEELAGLTGMKSRTVRRRLAQGRGRLLYKNQNTPYHFDAGTDAFYFVGTEYRTLYTDENAYRLLSSRRKGARMAVAGGGGPGAGAAAGTFTETLTIEEDALVGAVFDDNADTDYWFAGYIAKGREGNDPLVVNLDLPDAAATGPMLLRLHIRGATGFIPGPDHRVRVALNGTELGLWEWDGQAERVLEARADQSLLKPEGNVLTLRSEFAGKKRTFQYFNRVVVRYQRRMRAQAGSLWLDDLPAGIHTVDGFGKQALVVIESPGTPKARWRKDITVAPSPGGGYEVSFAAARTADYLVAEADAALMPRVSADSPSRWRRRRGRADYLIIAPRELSATAEALKLYRQERFTVKIAWLEDLYDEFSYGRVDAGALEQFLFRVGWRWRQAPEYVVLLGKGTLDHRDRKGYADSLVPVRMTATPWGLFASDNRYADTDGDGVAEYALGRIPVSHDSEGLAYVAKLKAYEAAPSGAWTGRAVAAADNPDSAGDFHADSNVIAGDLAQAGYSVRRAYHPDDAVREILTDPETWESAYVNYVGHGAKSQLGGEGFLKNTDAASLANTALPLFAAMTCAVGDDTHPGFDSVAGELVRNGGGGAVAALAPTGLSLDADAHVLNRAFVKGLTAGRSLGDAWQESQEEAREKVAPFMLRIYQVTGDPAVALKK